MLDHFHDILQKPVHRHCSVGENVLLYLALPKSGWAGGVPKQQTWANVVLLQISQTVSTILMMLHILVLLLLPHSVLHIYYFSIGNSFLPPGLLELSSHSYFYVTWGTSRKAIILLHSWNFMVVVVVWEIAIIHLLPPHVSPLTSSILFLSITNPKKEGWNSWTMSSGWWLQDSSTWRHFLCLK